MEEYKVRVLVEEFELQKKLTKLEKFLDTYSGEDKEILDRQFSIMFEYDSILKERISKWLED